MSYKPKIIGTILLVWGLIILFWSSKGFGFYLESIPDLLAILLVLAGLILLVFFKK